MRPIRQEALLKKELGIGVCQGESSSVSIPELIDAERENASQAPRLREVFDTSILIAAFLARPHAPESEHQEASIKRFATAVKKHSSRAPHALAEVYASMNARPAKPSDCSMASGPSESAIRGKGQ